MVLNGAFNANGSVQFGPGSKLAVNSAGSVQVNSGGAIDSSGTMTSAQGSVWDIKAGGDLTMSSGADATFAGAVNSAGDFTAAAGFGSANGVKITVSDTGNFRETGGHVTVGVNDTWTVLGTVKIGAGAYRDQGQVFVLATGTFTDGDAITVAAGATLDVTGSLIEDAGGHLDVFGTVTIEPGASLNDFTTITIEPGGVLDVFGAISVAQTASLDIFGTVIVEKGATYSLLGTVTAEPGGVLQLPKASTSTALTVSAGTPLAGIDPVTLTAAVTITSPTTATLAGMVDFFDSTTGIDLGSSAVVNGVASLTAGPFAAGGHTITVTYSGDDDFLPSSGTASLSALPPASLSGAVFADFNNDGQIDFGEAGISGVSVHLTGTDDLGHAVDRTLQTDGDGAYVFLNLRPGSYYLTRTTQPAEYTAGIDSVGTTGGTLSTTIADQFFVQLAQGVNGLNYNYGERPAATGSVQKGQTAGIGFWNNKNGQALILALNGGGSSHELGDWLAATFVNMYGVNSSNDLAGKNNAYIAALFQQDFLQKGMKLDAQVLATALSVYATNATLDSTQAAAKYGFTVSGYGVGTATFNVGSNGDGFGLANNTTMTVLDLLLATDSQAGNGLLYNGNTTLRTEGNDVFNALNQAGGIG
jgi:hypothetical protein